MIEPILIDAETARRFNESSSTSEIAEGRVRKPFVWDDKEYVVTGSMGGGNGTSVAILYAHQVVDRGVFEGATFSYADKCMRDHEPEPEDFYQGIRVKQGSRELVLIEPGIEFQFKEENIMKKIDQRTTKGKREYKRQIRKAVIKRLRASAKIRSTKAPKTKALAVIHNRIIAPVAVDKRLVKLDFNGWKDEGKKLKNVERGLGKEVQRVQMAIGAWYNFGIHRWKKNAERAAKVLGYTLDTIQNFAWVDRRIPRSLRNDNLTFEHYRVAAALPREAQRKELLAKAIKNQISGKELRRQVQESKGVKAKPRTTVERREQSATGLTKLIADWRAKAKQLMATPAEDKLAKAQADVYFDCAHALATALGLKDG